MELEQRVKTLEYEFKILKNEVQRTLLDIQEQLLVHYYPTLRAEESAPSAATVQAFEAVRGKSVPVAAPAPVAMPPPVSAPTPIVKKVSLDQVRETQGEMGATKNQAQLLQWSVRAAAKFGSVRVKDLIEVYSAKADFPADLKTGLIEMAMLGQHAGPPQYAVNDLVQEMLKLDALLGRVMDAEASLAMIEEAKLG